MKDGVLMVQGSRFKFLVKKNGTSSTDEAPFMEVCYWFP